MLRPRFHAAPRTEHLSSGRAACSESILNSWRKPRLLWRLETPRGVHSAQLQRSPVRNLESCAILLGKPYQSVCTHTECAERALVPFQPPSIPCTCNPNGAAKLSQLAASHRHGGQNSNVFTVMFTLAIVSEQSYPPPFCPPFSLR